MRTLLPAHNRVLVPLLVTGRPECPFLHSQEISEDDNFFFRNVLPVTLLVLMAACAPRLLPYRYLSFEDTPEVNVDTVAAVEVERLLFGPSIPVRYSIERGSYSLRIEISPRYALPHATVRVEESNGLRLKPRPWRGTRTDRERPCGYIDDLSPVAFRFRWPLCGEKADPGEFVIAFDVLNESGETFEEDLPFELKTAGKIWFIDAP